MSAHPESIRSFFNVYAELLDAEQFEAWTALFDTED